jgi:hypothetical protein
LLLVFLQQLVRVAQHDLPLAALAAVGLRTAKRVGPRLAVGVPDHVLEIDGVGEVVTDHRHDRLLGTVGGGDAFRSPVEAGADLFPAALVAAESAHDHHVVGV